MPPGQPVVAMETSTAVVAAAALKFCSLPESFPVFQRFLLNGAEKNIADGEVRDEITRICQMMEPQFLETMSAEIAVAVDKIKRITT